jgi:hypothetical protein
MEAVPLHHDDDERQESAVVGVVVVFAVAVGLGCAAWQQGWLGGGNDVVKTSAPVMAFVHKEAGGDPERILMSGFVLDEAEGKGIEASLKRAFPGSEIKNAVRIDTPRPGVKKSTRKSTVRLSFAADAVNEAWPRARFGEVKRLELVWKDEKVTVRGAVFAAETRAALEKAFGQLPKDHQGVLQLRNVQRPAVPAAQLQQEISTTVAGRALAFDGEGKVDLADAATASIVGAVAPLLKDLRGLDVWVSAGADDRAAALKQAEAVKAALVAAGADGNGLRPVPAAKNNPFSLIVRERE